MKCPYYHLFIVAYLLMLRGYGKSKNKYLDLSDFLQGHDLMDTYRIRRASKLIVSVYHIG
jgi:hypothetical protein